MKKKKATSKQILPVANMMMSCQFYHCWELSVHWWSDGNCKGGEWWQTHAMPVGRTETQLRHGREFILLRTKIVEVFREKKRNA